MAGRKLEDEREITARPKSLSDELPSDPVAEPGLSIEPEDIGRQFLNDATEQANHESQRGGDTPEIGITNPSPTDEAISSPNFEPDHTIWDQTVNLALQEGGVEELEEHASAEGTDQNQGVGAVDDEVDIVGPVVHDGSLFDHEAGELGEVESPNVETDEMAHDDARRVAAAENRTRRPAPRRQSVWPGSGNPSPTDPSSEDEEPWSPAVETEADEPS